MLALGTHKTRALERSSLADLREALESMPNDVRTRVQELANEQAIAQEAELRDREAKRKAKFSEDRAAKRLRSSDTSTPNSNSNSYSYSGNFDDFLRPPSPETIRACHTAFIDGSSDAALERQVCLICARHLMANTGEELELRDIPNRHHLIPEPKHFAHHLTDDLLLEHNHIKVVDGILKGWACKPCLSALRDDKLPRLSLANRMWIGPIPIEISSLTIPEQNLISLYHPRCYVYKLYPRNLWTGSDNGASLQTGLTGNVTSFALNIPDVARMLDGKLLPHPPAVLASTIAITFIGRGSVPKRWLQKTFRVRREAVYAALMCFKYTTRHPGYQNIELDSKILDALPEDDVPVEILASIGQHDDIALAQQEEAGYANYSKGTATEEPDDEQQLGKYSKSNPTNRLKLYE